MLKLGFDPQQDLRQVLCLGAHSDDIEIGCCGALLRLIDRCPDLSVTWVVFAASGKRGEEALESARALLEPVKKKKILLQDFRDGFFPYCGREIKEFFEQLKQAISPDLVFTHFRQDLHQDHRVISDLTWNTFRDHMILEYEIPKYDGDFGSPNLFFPLDWSTCRKKVRHLMDHFQTQENKHWFTEETFLSVMRLRGMEARAPGRYAEGFYCRKAVLW